MTRDEWLVLAIAAADEAGISPIQLQQSVFLFSLKREKDLGPDFYDFEPHNYGSAAKEAEGFATLSSTIAPVAPRVLTGASSTDFSGRSRRPRPCFVSSWTGVSAL